MELNILLDSDLLSLNQDYGNMYIEMTFLVESGERVKVTASNEGRHAINVSCIGLQLSANRLTSDDVPTLGEVEGVSFLKNKLSLEGDFGLIEVRCDHIQVESAL
ncbi:hypothetical protein [Vibrio sp. SCSIO 43136]|uniref:hypothetical protein n=1 Tax=Vibrio sp. SCSIO 43136 TaxID=2819101 RepID=UPI0020766164|nr:hypothetical protein [Vibrio sp. SCSIO 43136]USD66848.1 hypothetical protein J4N39_19545 [Vibrio sp. SCSIO 43136]